MARDSEYVRFSLRVFGEISAIILVPALLVLAGARFLLAHAFSRPSVFALIAAAFILTFFVLARRIRSYGRSFERMTREGKNRPV